MSSGRGGARHFAKPLVDADVLFSILSANEELVADLGSYEHLSKAYAPDPKGLLHCLDLWKALVKAEPSGSCHMRPMRQALLSLLVKKPKLNTTTQSGEVWANLRVERLTCILMHVRKVKRDGLQALLAAKLSRDEMALVESGLQLLSLPPLENGGTSALGKADALGKASALEKAKSSSSLGEKELAIVPFVSENKKKRKLQEKSSDPSVDGLGFPKMFDSPEQLGKAASQSASPRVAKIKKGWAEGFGKFPGPAQQPGLWWQNIASKEKACCFFGKGCKGRQAFEREQMHQERKGSWKRFFKEKARMVQALNHLAKMPRKGLHYWYSQGR